MEAGNRVLDLRPCCDPTGTLPSDTGLHCLLVAFQGFQFHVNAPLHARLWDDHQHVSPGCAGCGDVGAHDGVLPAQPNEG